MGDFNIKLFCGNAFVQVVCRPEKENGELSADILVKIFFHFKNIQKVIISIGCTQYV